MATGGYVPRLDERGERNLDAAADVLLVSEANLTVVVHFSLRKQEVTQVTTVRLKEKPKNSCIMIVTLQWKANVEIHASLSTE